MKGYKRTIAAAVVGLSVVCGLGGIATQDAAAKDVHVRKGHTYNVPSGWELRQIWVYGGPKLVRACNAGTGASYLCRYGNKYGEWRWTPMAVVDYPAKRQYQPRVEATYHDVWVVIKRWGPLY